MRSKHGNSLHFISSAVHFFYKNFQKKSIFSTTTSPKSRFSLHKHPPKKPFFGFFFSKKSLPKTQGRHPPGGGAAVPTRRPSPTLLYQSLPKMVKNPIFRGSKNGPKIAQKLPKMVQKWPNNSRGCPQKCQKIPQKSKKWPKTATEPHVIALKRVKMH